MVNEIVLDGNKLNDFQHGRIMGMIWALTGRPEKEYAMRHRPGSNEYIVTFESTEQQLIDVIDAINTVFPGVITHKKD